ncbi:hypothetical protein SAMN04487914_15012 [Arthrobacter sp. ok909]|uniref:hypothetical protein n=1 Tax=Arthrobacter sp. ok909 TaxID=1761746 RepID=UPI0008859597|nr:hypothetical protein [Arthrobacter sp. ok909]SDP83096.1 hypothetical protein SAMN04487914_15012 [Arthrobacter sp. ok909]
MGPGLIGKFTLALHPRADDGRFTAVTLSEPFLQLPATADSHFAQRSEAAAWFPEDIVDLEIMDAPVRQGTMPLARWEARGHHHAGTSRQGRLPARSGNGAARITNPVADGVLALKHAVDGCLDGARF